MSRSFLFLSHLLLLLLASALLCHPVSAGELPVAGFSISPESGTVPLDVKMTDASKGSNITRFWWFGDGAFSSAPDPGHIYTESGSYTVTLSVSDDAGHTRSEKKIRHRHIRSGIAAEPGTEPVYQTRSSDCV